MKPWLEHVHALWWFTQLNTSNNPWPTFTSECCWFVKLVDVVAFSTRLSTLCLDKDSNFAKCSRANLGISIQIEFRVWAVHRSLSQLVLSPPQGFHALSDRAVTKPVIAIAVRLSNFTEYKNSMSISNSHEWLYRHSEWRTKPQSPTVCWGCMISKTAGSSQAVQMLHFNHWTALCSPNIFWLILFLETGHGVDANFWKLYMGLEWVFTVRICMHTHVRILRGLNTRFT